jgi:FlaA1/EpsC-like NDP-sugar epimerase
MQKTTLVTSIILAILVYILGFVKILSSNQFFIFVYGDLAAFIVVLSMERITAHQSILKRHQRLITAILLSAVSALTISLAIFTINSILSAFILAIFDTPVFLVIRTLDWRAEREQKPNQSLNSKIWEK